MHTPSPVIILPYDNALVISCEARGNPPPQYRWTKDGQEFDFPREETITTGSRNGNFSFHKKHSVQFVGKWRCFASNKLGTAMTEEIEITLLVSPKFPKETFDPVIVKEGEPITLQCNPPKGVPPRLLYWMTVDLRHIEQNERISMGTNGDLFFSYALSNDSRPDYCCVAAFSSIRTIVQKTAMSVKVEKCRLLRLFLDFSTQFETLYLIKNINQKHLLRAPSLLLPSGVQSQKVLMKGEDLELECFPGGLPTPAITWIKMGENLSDRHKMTNFNKHLSISNVDVNDQGKYMCMAENSAGKAVHYFDVIVQEDRKISGERFLISENGQSLKINSTEKGDSGEYVCEARNTEGTSTLTAVLEVKGIPANMNRGIFYLCTEKNKCNLYFLLCCQKSYVFRYNVTGGWLQIMNVNLRDEGRYTCIAKTNLDQDSASALLTVLDIPDAPTMLKISDVKSERNIVLSWEPGSDHNVSITEFVVEYEEDRWEPGSWKELQKVAGNQTAADLFLPAGLNYHFRVYSVNAIGPGPPSEPTERYTTPPAAPDKNPENIRIEGSLPHQMDISWEPLSPIEYNGNGLEYIVTYRKLGVEDDWKVVMVKEPRLTVKNTPTFIPYEIKVQSRNSFGSGPKPKSVTGYSGEDVPTAAPRDVAVEVINSTAVRVSWTPVPAATVRGHLGGYNVYCMRMTNLLDPDKTVNVSNTMSFPGNRSHVIVPGLKPFSAYKLAVSVFNKKGKGPKSDPVTFNTPEGVPESVPILTISNYQEDSALLVWGPPTVMNGFLSGYILHYHLLNETSLEVIESQETNVTGADITQWKLSGLKDSSRYLFHLSACTQTGCGPPLSFESVLMSTLGGGLLGNISLAVNTSQKFHIIDGLKPGTVYTVRLMDKKLLANASIFEDVIQTRVKGFREYKLKGAITTQSWLIGTLCAVALLTLVAIMACFVLKNKGGKYAVKEKEDLYPDVESQGIHDELLDYGDYDEKPLKRVSLHFGDGEDSISRDSLVDYTDGEEEFNEDGSFIGEYSGPKYKGSINEPNGLSTVTA
uniref:Cell adhesion molecule with homology to L1CAM (Close homolog of L1) a n=1 Tax=Nothobranchius furzeri TaxID=105023 RepID=A0A8C6Q660_NOTFU